jgi:uncharacterized protein YpmB
MENTRRQLLRSVALFGGALISTRFITACAADANADENIGTESDELVTCKPTVISANHGHALVVSPADVAAGVAKTYSIKGTSGHDHKLVVTAAQFAQLAKGGSLSIVSSTDAGHSHTVQVSCAASVVTPPAKCANGAAASVITQNHGHSLKVAAADIVAGAAKTYSIKGTSGHNHTISVTAAQFAQLKSGTAVVTTSTNDAGHTHSVTVSCA